MNIFHLRIGFFINYNIAATILAYTYANSVRLIDKNQNSLS